MSTENEAAIKVIVELQAKPGWRAALMSLLESVVAEHGPDQRGFLGSTRYEVLDNPNIVVEIADWESAEARAEAMQKVMASGAYAPLAELLAAPFRSTVSGNYLDPYTSNKPKDNGTEVTFDTQFELVGAWKPANGIFAGGGKKQTGINLDNAKRLLEAG